MELFVFSPINIISLFLHNSLYAINIKGVIDTTIINGIYLLQKIINGIFN